VNRALMLVACASLASAQACGSTPQGSTPQQGSPGTAPTVPPSDAAADAVVPSSPTMPTSPTNSDSGSLGDGGSPGSCSGSGSTSLIYLAGQDAVEGGAPDPNGPTVLYSFDPSNAALERIGVIPCAPSLSNAGQCQVFGLGGCVSLAVDSKGTAWLIGYDASPQMQLVQAVSTTTGACIGSSTPVTGQAAPFYVMGSAFVSSGSNETLYIALGEPSTTVPLSLGVLDPQTGSISDVMDVSGAPDAGYWPLGWWSGGDMAADASGHLLLSDWYYDGPDAWDLLEIDPTNPSLVSSQVLPSTILQDYGKWTSPIAFSQGSLYFFPWWPPNPNDQTVQKLDLSTWTASNVTSDLGAYVFAASAGPATTCRPAGSQ
jgi:hypothetical protein